MLSAGKRTLILLIGLKNRFLIRQPQFAEKVESISAEKWRSGARGIGYVDLNYGVTPAIHLPA